MDDRPELERAATDLVRYALACHAAGKPIRREDMRAHVLAGVGARSFKPVMENASQLLQDNFGLRMVPLPAHERTANRGGHGDTQQSSKPTTKWVLQNALSDTARERLDLVQSDDDKSLLGFAAMVLSLIFVNNMSIANDQLVLYVRKLGPPNCVLPPSEARDIHTYGTDAQMESAAQSAVSYLVRHGYLDKLLPHGARGGAGETQATQATQQTADLHEPDSDLEYTWGPQAKVMLQPLDMARFIAAVADQECTPDFIKTIGRAYGQSIGEVDGT
ncbi:hypothetical protein GGF46_001146 [Coemansia sp. RSA 552]|nr:hypothetical protein GGF46_001146 [Coemansia sp. RSA 552]